VLRIVPPHSSNVRASVMKTFLHLLDLRRLSRTLRAAISRSDLRRAGRESQSARRGCRV